MTQKGFAAHFLLAAPNTVLHCGGVLLDGQGRVTDVFSLDECQAEPANVAFTDGWIAPFLADVEGILPGELQSHLLKQAETTGKTIGLHQEATLFKDRKSVV